MKTTEASAHTIVRTLCPFCSFGCEFGVIFDDFGVKGIEYIKDGSSEGRLCPRGSAAAFYLNHPMRLSLPIKNKKVQNWPKVIKDLKKILNDPKKVVVTFDRNITLEEYESIIGFCNTLGIENIASTYFEPEAFLKKFLDKPFSADDINDAQIIVVLGDPFNQAPMISKSLINWKLSDRKNRLVVIDSINTHTAVFASDFLKVKVGTEPLLLFGLAQENIGGIDISGATGIVESKIKDISQSVRNVKKGLIFTVLPFGHTYDPLLFVEGISVLSKYSGMKVVPLFEFAGLSGKQFFGSIVDLIKRKKIKHLVNFGELFPYYYPQIHKSLKALNIISTSPLKFNGFTSLPVALNLEKKGTIITSFGKKSLSGNIRPASGAKTIDGILNLIKEDYGKGKPLEETELKVDIKERAEKILEKSVTTKKKRTFKLVGEKIAYNFLNFFEREMMKLNPLDAGELGIRSNDIISIKSKHGNVDLKAKLTKDVETGIVAVPAEIPEVKGLFDFEIDNNIVNFIPTEVEIWRKE